MKKGTKKIKVASKKLKSQVVESEPQLQSMSYWMTRPVDDEHKDWNYPGTWIEGYIASAQHPHRDLILNNLGEFESLAEIGCNAAPNLSRINQRFDGKKLAGIDISELAIDAAKATLPDSINVQMGSFLRLPWDTQSFDVILCDAVLMYAGPSEIDIAISEIERVARKTVIIVDRFSKEESNNGYIWSRDYEKLMNAIGFDVKTIKIKKKEWPGSKGWEKQGCVFVCHRR